MLKNYLNYLKDNPKGYWFKKKLYGWGWVPVKWQGWAVIAIFVLFLIWNSIGIKNTSTYSDAFWFLVKVILAVSLLLVICYEYGEKPGWQWGIPKNDNKNGK